jgi:hypothetical protein
MRHRRYERMIPLLLYGDLNAMQREELHSHLETCERCRRTLGSTRDLHRLLGKVPVQEFSQATIREARVEGLAAVRRAAGGGARILSGGLASRPALRWAYAVGAIALLSGTFVAGRLTAPATPLSPEGEVRVTNIRLSGIDGRDVDATFDLVRPVRIRGSMDDPAIQKVLASALVHAENPGVRLRAVSGVAAAGSLPADREVRTALILAARTDPNDAVRRAALQALLRYPADREIRDVLLEILTRDPNAALRVDAINGLDSLRSAGVRPDAEQRRSVLDEVQNEQNLYVRVKARSILDETTP